MTEDRAPSSSIRRRAGHECPGPDCTRRVPRTQLACRRHWLQVDSPIRTAVYGAYRAGTADDHVAAMRKAIAQMRPL